MEYLGDMTWYLDMLLDQCEDGTEVLGGIHKWTMPANWKFASENFLGDTYHNPSHRSVDMIGIGPSARAGQTGRRDNEYNKGQHVWISYPQGHGVHSVWMPPEFDYQPSYLQHPRVDAYFRHCFEERKRRRGDKATNANCAERQVGDVDARAAAAVIYHVQREVLSRKLLTERGEPRALRQHLGRPSQKVR